MPQSPRSITLEVPVSTHLHLFIMGKWMEDRRSVARPCGHGSVSIHFSLDRSVLVGLKGPQGEEKGTEAQAQSHLGWLSVSSHSLSSAVWGICCCLPSLHRVCFQRFEFPSESYRDNHGNLYPGLGIVYNVIAKVWRYELAPCPRTHVKDKIPDMVTLVHNLRTGADP